MRKRDGDHCTVRAAGITAGTETRPTGGRALAEDLPEAQRSSSSPSEPSRHHAHLVSSETLPHKGLSPEWKEGGSSELVSETVLSWQSGWPSRFGQMRRAVWGYPRREVLRAGERFSVAGSFLFGHHPRSEQNGRAFSQGVLGSLWLSVGPQVGAIGAEGCQAAPILPLSLS